MYHEKEHKQDRRVLRTRKVLREALMSLIAEQGYDSLTVQNIIDRADVGRSTFYAHYRDLEDLLVSGTDDIVHSLIQGADDPGRSNTGPVLSTEPLFRHAQEQFRLHKAIVGGGGINVIVRKIQKHLGVHIQEWLEEMLPANRHPGVPLALLSYHISHSALTLLRWWLDNNRPHSPREMDRMFQEMVMPGVHRILED